MVKMIEKAENNVNSIWLCKCDCGKTIYKKRKYFQNPKSLLSCGCTRKWGNVYKKWKGVGLIPRQYFNTIQFRCKQKNIELSIDLDYMWKLFEQQNGKCALTGLSLKFGSQKRNIPTTASLDRIDSNKGYIPGNVQWLHKLVNICKNHFDQDYFIKTAKLVAIQALQNQPPK
jgi:hypothetical protein